MTCLGDLRLATYLYRGYKPINHGHPSTWVVLWEIGSCFAWKGWAFAYTVLLSSKQINPQFDVCCFVHRHCYDQQAAGLLSVSIQYNTIQYNTIQYNANDGLWIQTLFIINIHQHQQQHHQQQEQQHHHHQQQQHHFFTPIFSFSSPKPPPKIRWIYQPLWSPISPRHPGRSNEAAFHHLGRLAFENTPSFFQQPEPQGAGIHRFPVRFCLDDTKRMVYLPSHEWLILWLICMVFM